MSTEDRRKYYNDKVYVVFKTSESMPKVVKLSEKNKILRALKYDEDDDILP